jgi:hypothetical protein
VAVTRQSGDGDGKVAESSGNIAANKFEGAQRTDLLSGSKSPSQVSEGTSPFQASDNQRKVFPCPYCSTVTFYFWSLSQHIQAAHGKHPSDIKRMTRSLRRKSYKMSLDECVKLTGKVPSPWKQGAQKSASSTAKTFTVTRTRSAAPTARKKMESLGVVKRQLSLSPERSGAANTTPTPSSPLLHACPHCQRAFGRAISLQSHLKICTKRKEEAQSMDPGDGVGGGDKVEGCAKKEGGASATEGMLVTNTDIKPVRHSARTPKTTSKDIRDEAGSNPTAQTTLTASKRDPSASRASSVTGGSHSRDSSVDSRRGERSTTLEPGGDSTVKGRSSRPQRRQPQRDSDSRAGSVSSRDSSVDSVRTRGSSCVDRPNAMLDSAKSESVASGRSRSTSRSKPLSSRDSSVDSHSSAREKGGRDREARSSRRDGVKVEHDLLSATRQLLSQQLQAASTTPSDNVTGQTQAGSSKAKSLPAKREGTSSPVKKQTGSTNPTVLRKKEGTAMTVTSHSSSSSNLAPSVSSSRSTINTATPAPKPTLPSDRLQGIGKGEESSKPQAPTVHTRQSGRAEDGPAVIDETNISHDDPQDREAGQRSKVATGETDVDFHGNTPQVPDKAAAASQRPKRKRRAPLKISDSAEDRLSGNSWSVVSF